MLVEAGIRLTMSLYGGQIAHAAGGRVSFAGAQALCAAGFALFAAVVSLPPNNLPLMLALMAGAVAVVQSGITHQPWPCQPRSPRPTTGRARTGAQSVKRQAGACAKADATNPVMANQVAATQTKRSVRSAAMWFRLGQRSRCRRPGS